MGNECQGQQGNDHSNAASRCFQYQKNADQADDKIKTRFTPCTIAERESIRPETAEDRLRLNQNVKATSGGKNGQQSVDQTQWLDVGKSFVKRKGQKTEGQAHAHKDG